MTIAAGVAGEDLDAFLRGRALGVVTAERPCFDAEQNRARTSDMVQAPRAGLGLILIETSLHGRPGSPNDPDATETSLLLIGPKGEDHGRVKGAVVALGTRYDQHLVLWKRYDGNNFEALRLQGNPMGDLGRGMVGRFHPSGLNLLHAALHGHSAGASSGSTRIRRPQSFFSRRSTSPA